MTPPEQASAGVSTRASTGYGWPIKPFNSAHPVRGNFGDPRMVFRGPPTERTVYHRGGSFNFHRGADIYGPAGTKVYPVRDGRVMLQSASHFSIESADGTIFEYWHLDEKYLPLGTVVHAYRTMLGTIQPSFQHVDLTEVQGGRPVNPLAPGHLTPYRDKTRPVVADVHLQSNDAGHVVFPNFVQGRVWLEAEAYDRPALSVPGPWHGLPVVPALVTWQIKQAKTGKVVVAPTEPPIDFRTSEPSSKSFWSVYMRGTYQNMTVFGNHESFMEPGCYLFRLSPTMFDTHSLPDGVYDLVVTATDIRRNSSSQSLRFDIHNRAGWPGS